MSLRSCTASTSPSVRSVPPSPRSSSVWVTPAPWTTPSLSQLLPLMLLHCNTWHHTLAAPWENTSVTMESTLSSSMTICPSKPSPTVKCHCCCVVPQVVKLTPVMSSTFTVACWNVPPRCLQSSEVDHSLPSPSLKHKLVTCRLTFQPMSSQLLTARSSWKPSCSTRVFVQLSTSVCLSHVSVQLPRPRPWNR